MTRFVNEDRLVSTSKDRFTLGNGVETLVRTNHGTLQQLDGSGGRGSSLPLQTGAQRTPTASQHFTLRWCDGTTQEPAGQKSGNSRCNGIQPLDLRQAEQLLHGPSGLSSGCGLVLVLPSGQIEQFIQLTRIAVAWPDRDSHARSMTLAALRAEAVLTATSSTW